MKKINNVKTLTLVIALALVIASGITTTIAMAFEKEDAPQSQTVVTYVPAEGAKNVSKWIKVESEDEIYLVTEDLDRAYVWNLEHHILPHMYFEVCENAEEISNLEELIKNAENFYEAMEPDATVPYEPAPELRVEESVGDDYSPVLELTFEEPCEEVVDELIHDCESLDVAFDGRE